MCDETRRTSFLLEGFGDEFGVGVSRSLDNSRFLADEVVDGVYPKRSSLDLKLSTYAVTFFNHNDTCGERTCTEWESVHTYIHVKRKHTLYRYVGKGNIYFIYALIFSDTE